MGFEERAQGWLAWARTPGHDAYWIYRDAFFALVPAPGAATLEVGCGEGRVARDLVARGHRVTGLDASPTLLRAAAEADPASRYVVAPPRRCPSTTAPSTSSSPTTASWTSTTCRSLWARPPASSRRAGGCARASRIRSRPPATWDHAGRGTPLVVGEAYLERRWMDVAVEREGLEFTFEGWCYPLEAYTRALEDAGLLIEAMRSPPTPRAGAGRACRCSSCGARSVRVRRVRRVGTRRVGDPHVDVVVVVDERHDDRARPAQVQVGPDEELDRAGRAEAVDEVLSQRAVDLGGAPGAAQRAVAARVHDVGVEAVLVRGVAEPAVARGRTARPAGG